MKTRTVLKYNAVKTHCDKGKGKGKGKVVPVLFFTEHHALKTYCRRGGIAQSIL
jgi:hypothetical protein